jgi:hypothetical protein
MKKIKIAIVRTIMEEELYEVEITEEKAKDFEKAGKDKALLANLISDEYQAARRKNFNSTLTTKGINDTVTYIKIKITDIK